MDWLSNFGSALGNGVSSGLGDFFGSGGTGRDPNFWMSALGSGGGLAGAISNYGQQNAAQAQHDRLLKQMNTYAGTPTAVQPFLNPLRQQAEDAYLRTMKANMATSGIPFDSSYANNMMAEGMAQQEANYWNQAQQQANQFQQQNLNTMGQGLGNQARPNLLASIFGNNMGGLGNYFAKQQEMKNQQAAQAAQRDQFAQMWKMMQGMGGPGAAVTTNLPGMQQQGPSQAPDASLGNMPSTSTTGQPYTGNLNPYGSDSFQSDYASPAS